MHSCLVVAVDSSSNERIMVELLSPFALAERVVEAANKVGIATAMIGASALAAHNYVRGTRDIDFATAVDPRSDLPKLEQALLELGLSVELRMPDEDDPIGGVLVVWESEDSNGERTDPVEVVNFYNPFRPRPNPAANAIKNAVRLDHDSPLRCVRLPDLIALKLYAGGLRDHADVVELLVHNPAADLDEVRAVGTQYDVEGRLEGLIAQAANRHNRRR